MDHFRLVHPDAGPPETELGRKSFAAAAAVPNWIELAAAAAAVVVVAASTSPGFEARDAPSPSGDSRGCPRFADAL